MSQIKSPEEEAAELLPCLWIETGCQPQWVCTACKRRPAVAEQLANYREQLRQRDEWIKAHESTIQALSDRGLQQSERIAALEARINNPKQLANYREQLRQRNECLTITDAALAATGRELDKCRQRIAALEAALEPFATDPDRLRDKDSCCCRWCAARAALAGRGV